MIDYDAHKWTHHLLDVRGSMVREIIYRVFACTVWAIFVGWFDEYFIHKTLPSTVHALVGTALGLLLVFRTNASYDRFWEGRKLWGGIVNETRNLARLSRALIAPKNPKLHAEIVHWTVTWPYVAMHTLRGKKNIGPLESLLVPADVERALAANHSPLWIATHISKLIYQARSEGLIDTIQAQAIDINVQQLIDYVGACERIVKTPLPFAYVVHLRRALILYTFTLPIALLKEFGWAMVFAVFIVSYIFFGIEEIGVQIEDPFGHDENDLPLERICSTIENNLLNLVDTEPFKPQLSDEADHAPLSIV
jgi:putative membrane protein